MARVWNFLESQFAVTVPNRDTPGNTDGISTSTHVHLSVPGGFTLPQIKRLAQAVIHFECAVEVLMPAHRRGNEYAKSNWIDNLLLRGNSRDKCMLQVEDCISIGEVIARINPGRDRYFGVNFMALGKYKTVEFRRGAGSSNVDEVFQWVEFALTFLQASMALSTVSDFHNFSPNVGGLQAFFKNARRVVDPGMNQPKYLDVLFKGHRPDAWLQPVPVNMDTMSARDREKLRIKKAADARRVPFLEKLEEAQRIGMI